MRLFASSVKWQKRTRRIRAGAAMPLRFFAKDRQFLVRMCPSHSGLSGQTPIQMADHAIRFLLFTKLCEHLEGRSRVVRAQDSKPPTLAIWGYGARTAGKRFPATSPALGCGCRTRTDDLLGMNQMGCHFPNPLKTQNARPSRVALAHPSVHTQCRSTQVAPIPAPQPPYLMGISSR